MKITYFKLVNFCNINAALKTDKIEIDFSKNKNKIILITGPNGSGKTSILSCLHPFANNGNLDVRNDLPLVLQGKNGEKELHIVSGDNKYIIKHFYTPSKETHTVKSYIEKNGVELNLNGNVTSFKDVVQTEFELEPDFLKLIRLGSNVTNFIDLKTTERKTFMGKILSDVDVYLMLFKRVSLNLREIKSVISHLMDKIQKLGVGDNEEELINTKKKLEKEISRLSNEIATLTSDLGAINHEITKFESPIVIKEKLDLKKKELEKIIKSLKSSEMTFEECEELLSKLNDDLVSSTTKYDSLIDKRDDMLSSLNKQLDELDLVDRELEKMNNNTDIKDAEFIIEELRKTIENRSKEAHLAGYEPKYSKKELEKLIVDLDRCNDILYTTYEFGKQPIEKAISCILSKQNITTYVDDSIKRSNKNKLQTMCEYVYKEITNIVGNVHANCNGDGCGIFKFYNELYDLATQVPDTIVEDETFLMYTKLSYQNIMSIIDIIKENKSIIENLPDSIKDSFKTEVIFNRIKSSKSLYEKELLYGELSMVTEYELQDEDRGKLKDAKDRLSLLKKSISNLDYFTERQSSLINDIDNLKESLSSIKTDITELYSHIHEVKSDIDRYIELKTSISNRDTVESEFESLSNDYNLLKELYVDKKEKEDNLYSLNKDLNKLTEIHTSIDYKLDSYKTLTAELSKYDKVYDDMVYIKDSLSAKDGIPLYHIQMYLQNIRDITNNLLRVIYNDELMIEDFDINADEFRIPYYTKGLTIKDVSHASQGERSFISLALSFALIYESISKYNILLLDEIDSTLDTGNRMKFIEVLLTLIDMIDAEQIFLISHNNMFNMYPVSVINMKNMQDDENDNADLIKLKIH